MRSGEDFTTKNLIVCTRMEEGRSTFKILTRIPLRRMRRKWEDNITIYLKEIGINTRDWFDSAQDWDYWKVLRMQE